MVNLFFNYYLDPSRQHEIDECLKRNFRAFDKVFLIYGRPTFRSLFSHSRQTDKEDINVFCNSDIYFEDVSLLGNIKSNECYALTRWNKIGDSLKFFNRADSQDSWVFRGHIQNVEADFTMGKWGCDNRLLHEIKRAGYNVLNPSLSIRTIHLHEVDNRSQERTKENTVPPPYRTILPHA